jgi:lipoprotein-releasing system permease protein
MGVGAGDTVTLIVPSGQMTPAGVVPRLKQMTVLGAFDSGHYEFDAGYAYLHMGDAAKLFRLSGPTGVRLKLDDYHLAPQVAVSVSATLGPIIGSATGHGKTAIGLPLCRWKNA